MSIFSRLFASTPTNSARFERLEAKVRALDEDTDKLQRAMKALELDWEQAYDKLSHLMARVTKRRAALEAESAAISASGATNGNPDGVHPTRAVGTHQTLSQMRQRVFGRS